jgi:spoIIIJ-associated protein
MIREFEGKTELEAIALAMQELQLEQDELDIEIIDAGKRGLFKKSNVRIRVHLPDDEFDEDYSEEFTGDLEAYEQQIIDFLSTILSKMGYSGDVQVNFRKNGKLGLEIISDHSSIIIGKKGMSLPVSFSQG